jgi:CheY-like chemotaxis protein
MIDILLISDQPRLHAILAATGKLPDGRLRISTSLNQGLEEMSSKAPDILFLQNRLSGLAGFILVRHVREETGSASTKIVLLSDSAEGSENSSADIELLTGVSDNELSDAISEIIGDQLGLQRILPVPSRQNLPATSGKPSPALNPDVTDNVSLSKSTRSAVKPPVPMRQKSNKQKNSSSKSEEPLPLQATILSSSPPPIQWEKKRLAIAIAIIAGLAMVALLATLFLGTSTKKMGPKTAVKNPAPRPAATPVQKAASSSTRQTVALSQKPTANLPSFIAPGGIDPVYSVTNPGWERYTSASREYKIYVDAGAIKAIQVLDRQSTGISAAFFASAIQEMAKVRDYRTVSKEQKGDFLVKKGKLSKTAEVILYKDKSDKILRAFVIHFGAQETITENKGSK